MTDDAVPADPDTPRTERALALDERSMRVMELGLAGVALLVAIVLAIAR